MSECVKKIDKDEFIHHDTVDRAFLEDIKMQWQSTLDAISDPIVIIDSHHTIIRSNLAMAEFTEHKDVKKIIGQKSYAVFAGLDQPPEECVAHKVFAQGVKEDYVYERLSDSKIFEISVFPLRCGRYGARYDDNRVADFQKNDDSEILMVVCVYRDRTLHYKMEDKIRQHDKLTSLGLLASGIAHEINNPLSGILLFSQMLLKELSAKDQHYGDVVEIESAAQRCKEIVHQVLDFSRQPKRTAQIHDEIELLDVIQSAERFSRVLKVAKDSRLIYEWGQPEVSVHGCRGRLIQVFINIFKNAFQAMPDGGEIYVSQWIEHIDNQLMVVVEVRDTGVGIPKEHMNRIFDPFFTTKSDQEGTGLGLAISYGIITELEGDLCVSSTPKEGTTITVTLKACGGYPPLKDVSLDSDLS